MDVDQEPFSFLHVTQGLSTAPGPSASEAPPRDSPFPGVEITHLLAERAKLDTKMNDAIGKYARVYCDDPAYVKLMEEDLQARDPEKEGQAWAKVSRFVANLYGLNCIAYSLFSLNVSFIFYR